LGDGNGRINSTGDASGVGQAVERGRPLLDGDTQHVDTDMLRKLKQAYYTLLMLDDTPHRIALGMALGVFIAWTPTIGFQTLLVIPLTWLTRANRVAGVIGVYLSNPFTIVPMYWLAYKVGALMLQETLTFREFREIVSLGRGDAWGHALVSLGTELLLPVCAGGLILGAVTAVVGYWVTHWFASRGRRLDDGNVPSNTPGNDGELTVR